MKPTQRKTVKTSKTSAPLEVKVKTTAATPTHEAIAARAYELYLSRGSVPGHDAEDWLTAEAELKL